MSNGTLVGDAVLILDAEMMRVIVQGWIDSNHVGALGIYADVESVSAYGRHGKRFLVKLSPPNTKDSAHLKEKE